MAVRYTCTACGRSRTYRYPKMGASAFPKHSCERTTRLAAERHRIEERKAHRGGKRRRCRHKYADHKHGTRQAYILDRCRCVPCMDAASAYERYRLRQIAYGRWTHRVAAGPARRRMLELQRDGIGFVQVAKLTGIPKTTLGTLIYGRWDRRGGRPPRTISREYAQRILDLVIDPLRLSPGHRIDATGTRRRLQALVAAGWSLNRIADVMGEQRRNVPRLFYERQVHVRKAQLVVELYERGWQGPPVASRFQQAGVTRAKRYAAERGWLPPMAWPEESIDDPAFNPLAVNEEPVFDELAVEEVLTGHRMTLGEVERLEVIERMTLRGASTRQIADALGTTGWRVQRDRALLGLTTPSAGRKPA